MIKLITNLTIDKLKLLADKGKIDNNDDVYYFDKRLLKVVQLFMKEEFDLNCKPIVCVSRMNGYNANLSSMIDSVDIYLPTCTGDILLEFKSSDDIVLSVDFNILLDIENQLKCAVDTFDIEYILKKFKKSLKLGSVESESNLSFVPYIYYNKCTSCVMMSPYGGVEHLDIRNLPTIELMDLF